MIQVSNIDTLTQYKMKVVQKLWQSQDLLDLIFNKKDVYVEQEQLDEYILPYDYVADTVTTAASFVGVETDIPKIINNTIKDVYVYIYISVHKSLMQINSKASGIKRSGIRRDLIAFEVDKIMNGNDDFGIGRVELYSTDRFRPQQDFYGRILIYKMKEFNKKQGGF